MAKQIFTGRAVVNGHEMDVSIDFGDPDTFHLIHGGTWDVRFRQASGELTPEQAAAILRDARTKRRLHSAKSRFGMR